MWGNKNQDKTGNTREKDVKSMKEQETRAKNRTKTTRNNGNKGVNIRKSNAKKYKWKIALKWNKKEKLETQHQNKWNNIFNCPTKDSLDTQNDTENNDKKQ